MAQHPLDHTAASFWQMCWEQGASLVVALAPLDPQECRPFWAAEAGASIFLDAGAIKIKVSTLDHVDNATWSAYRLSLEVI